MDLQFVSPKLLAARDLELAVPGTYRAREPIVRIASFVPTLSVFDTKQRPRRLSIHGSNGVEYAFLIKGTIYCSSFWNVSLNVVFRTRGSTTG